MSDNRLLNLNWPTPSAFPSLALNEVHVWAVPFEASVSPDEDVARILSTEELQRAAGFVVDKPRNAFVATRLALRVLLGRYLEVPPRDLSIVVDRGGKPRLAASEIEFNVSHSGTLALIAVARDCAIGVDVEQIRPVERLREIAERHFHPLELAAICAANEDNAAAVFLRCWTRKEAVIKAIGAGLKCPLSKFNVLGSQCVETSAQGDVPESRCHLRDVEPCDGYMAAVATRSAPQSVLGFTYFP